MIYELLITFIVVLGFLGMIVTQIGRQLPFVIKAIPIFALVLFWINSLVFRIPEQTGAVSIILVITFYILFIVFILPVGIGSFFFASLDRERDSEPVVAGNPDGKRLIYIVYHSGGSGFTRRAIDAFARYFIDSDIKIIMYSAHHRLDIALRKADAVGFVSPVYAGKIRPPVADYINRMELNEIKCFNLLTGADKNSAESNLKETEDMLTDKGASVIGGIKALSLRSEPPLNEQVKPLADRILSI